MAKAARYYARSFLTRDVRDMQDEREGSNEVGLVDSQLRAPTFSLEGGLDGLPLRVSNEGLPRPRVARAQEII